MSAETMADPTHDPTPDLREIVAEALREPRVACYLFTAEGSHEDDPADVREEKEALWLRTSIEKVADTVLAALAPHVVPRAEHDAALSAQIDRCTDHAMEWREEREALLVIVQRFHDGWVPDLEAGLWRQDGDGFTVLFEPFESELVGAILRDLEGEWMRVTIENAQTTVTTTLSEDEDIYGVVEAIDFALRGIGFDENVIHRAFGQYAPNQEELAL